MVISLAFFDPLHLNSLLLQLLKDNFRRGTVTNSIMRVEGRASIIVIHEVKIFPPMKGAQRLFRCPQKPTARLSYTRCISPHPWVVSPLSHILMFSTSILTAFPSDIFYQCCNWRSLYSFYYLCNFSNFSSRNLDEFL
jgi:hypothetical protein